MLKLPASLLLTSLLSVSCAPLNATDNEVAGQQYSASDFDEFYDQRQNGTSNVRVNLDGVVLVLTPAESLFAAASLLDPALFDSEYPDVEEILSGNRPEDLIRPETTSTTTSPESSTSATPVSETSSTSTEAASTAAVVIQKQTGHKRKFRLPGFIRPFIRKHPDK